MGMGPWLKVSFDRLGKPGSNQTQSMGVDEDYHLAPPDSYACMFIELLNTYMFI